MDNTNYFVSVIGIYKLIGGIMDDLDYIKNFIKISVPKICKKFKIDKSNLYSGKSTNLNAKKVRQEIESEIAKLYIKED